MSVTIKILKTLKKGNLIEASGLYYKVLGVKKTGLMLSAPFAKGCKVTGSWFSSFKSKYGKYDYPHWNIIRKNRKGGIVK